MCHHLVMSRRFKTANYQEVLNSTVRLGDCLPQHHIARFIVDIVEDLDLSTFYAHYGNRGGAPYSPEILLAVLFYAYCNGVFSSRKIEQACRDTVAYRYLAGNLTPDHDTIAAFRKQFLPELKTLFVQILLLAQQMGLLKIGNVSAGPGFESQCSHQDPVEAPLRACCSERGFCVRAGETSPAAGSPPTERRRTRRTARPGCGRSFPLERNTRRKQWRTAFSHAYLPPEGMAGGVQRCA
jgi:transposase